MPNADPFMSLSEKKLKFTAPSPFLECIFATLIYLQPISFILPGKFTSWKVRACTYLNTLIKDLSWMIKVIAEMQERNETGCRFSKGQYYRQNRLILKGLQIEGHTTT